MTDINPERVHKYVFNIGRADGTYLNGIYYFTFIGLKPDATISVVAMPLLRALRNIAYNISIFYY
jgi:hypothetical protein